MGESLKDPESMVREIIRLQEENRGLQNQVAALDLELAEEWEFGNPEMRYTEFVRLREENERLEEAIQNGLDMIDAGSAGDAHKILRRALAKEDEDGDAK